MYASNIQEIPVCVCGRSKRTVWHDPRRLRLHATEYALAVAVLPVLVWGNAFLTAAQRIVIWFILGVLAFSAVTFCYQLARGHSVRCAFRRAVYLHFLTYTY